MMQSWDAVKFEKLLEIPRKNPVQHVLLVMLNPDTKSYHHLSLSWLKETSFTSIRRDSSRDRSLSHACVS
eukprot:5083099-Amphidinium_carterae.1